MSPPSECPPDHRVLDIADIVVGREVTYISSSGSHIRTTIVSESLQNEGRALRLQCKNLAAVDRVFVPQPAVDNDNKERPTSAAIGAAAPRGPTGATGSPTGGTAAVAGDASAVGEEDEANEFLRKEDDSAVGEEDEANEFLRNKVAPWLDRLQHTAESGGKSLADALVDAVTASLGSTSPEEQVAAFKSKVPWGAGSRGNSYVGLQAVPKSSKRGTIHISMLSFEKTSYAANGLFLND